MQIILSLKEEATSSIVGMKGNYTGLNTLNDSKGAYNI